jgi:lipopolysaccharide/colanic/teichoic acid biosynthesis glycosyltransferase
MKRLFDIVFSFIGLIVISPILLFFMFLIWMQDHHSPFYVAPRAGRGGKPFRMIKLRSMVSDADKNGVDSTAGTDQRITKAGHIVRRYKLDEFSQLINVLLGDMSLVGPRPNVIREVSLYTEEEKHLLDLRPGITDLASIVFSDEGDILAGSENPDLEYNQIIRPWKSRLGLLYIENRNVLLDLYIIVLTVISILSRQLALKGVQKSLKWLGADDQLVRVAEREEPLQPYPPPGAAHIVKSR